MFANASCLFRTKFVDGVSTVTRTVNRVLNNTTNHQALADASNVPAIKEKGAKNARKRPAQEEQEVENA